MFGLNQVADSIKELKEEYKLKEESIDYYIFHQAQKLIINGIANECAINLEKVLNSYEDFGNTSSASIPINICKHANKIKETEKQGCLCVVLESDFVGKCLRGDGYSRDFAN